jgi:tetratricopeptide (TPR) repeat protein
MLRDVCLRSVIFVLVSAALEGAAFASDEQMSLARSEAMIKDAETRLADVVAMSRPDKPKTPEERLAVGELSLRQKDYAGAIAVFSQVVELFHQKKASESAHADALYFLAEAYFRDEQLLSARRHYKALAELATRGAYSTYAGRALGRLVDVALRTGRLDGLDFVFAELALLSGEDTSGSLAYAAGKAHFARRNYPNALTELKRVPERATFALRAGYLTGVVYTNEVVAGSAQPLSDQEREQLPTKAQRFGKAILQFQSVAQNKAASSDDQHVIDLAWMALARLFYESDELLDAADAYNHVGRTSPEFPIVLFELAWVYVRMQDYRRAEQALELLAVVSPETLSFAEGALLRADLMLRSKNFEGAREVYQSVKSRFEPAQGDISVFLVKTTDPAVYYDRLIEDRVGVRTEDDIPPVVMDWVREESEDQRVFALIDDVMRSRELIKDGQRMASKMETILTSSARAKAFPDLKLRLQHSLGILNELSQAKRALALGLEAADDSAYAGALGDARAKRRELMDRMKELPVTPSDFSRRETAGQEEWNGISQRIQQLTLETDRLQAVVNGLRRVLRDADKYGVVRSEEAKARFQREIEDNEQQIEIFKRLLTENKELLERGRIQIGFGDSRYVEDRKIRADFAKAFSKEVGFLSDGSGGGNGRDFVKRARPLLERGERVERRLRELIAGFEREVADGAVLLRQAVAEEAHNLRAFGEQLDGLDQNARLLVGEVAKRTFGLVRERLESIVLRADVGIVQQAWEVREHHREKVRNLQRKRSSEDQQLNAELEEVLHQGGGKDRP